MGQIHHVVRNNSSDWLPGECQEIHWREEFLKILSSSWRSSTEKSYSSAWKKWMGWCSERKLDPSPTSITTIIEFLAYQFQQGFPYSTIIEGQQVGQHPLVCKLLQGMFNLCPVPWVWHQQRNRPFKFSPNSWLPCWLQLMLVGLRYSRPGFSV